MNFLRRFFVLLFAPSFAALEREALLYGRLTFSHVDLETGLGWHCSLRPQSTTNGYNRTPRYAWTASGVTMREALADVIAQAKDNPISRIQGVPCAPRLGGREFDPEPGERP